MQTGMSKDSPMFQAQVVGVGLALLGVLAVVGLLSLSRLTVPRPAEASIQDTAQFNSAKVDLARLTEPLSTPPQATAALSGGASSINPADPGAATRLQVSFTVGAAGQLNSGTGEIVITLDDDFQVPATLDRNQITISTTEVSNSSDGCDPAVSVCSASDATAPQSVTLDFVGSENDEPEITLLVPDMIAGTNDPAIGSQGIASDSTVTVVFQQSAGIKNSTEAGNRSVKVRTTGTGDTADFSLPSVAVPMRVEMSSNGEPRNEAVDLVALGVEGGTNVTFWLDLNGDGHRPNEPGFLVQPGEQDLCAVVAASSDIAVCTFTVSNPPFVPGLGDDCTLPTLVGCNFINAKDGDINPRTTNFPLALTQAFVDRQNFELEPTLEVFPSSANLGDRVIVSLFDYPPGDIILAAGVTIGGVAATTISPATTVIASNGQGNFTLTIPAGVRRGVQKINVATNSGAEQDTNITIGGALLQLSTNDTVIANQDLTIFGSGFATDFGTICVPERLIMLDDISLGLDSDSINYLCDDIPEPGDVGVELSSAGTFAATVQVVRSSDFSIPIALLSAGVKELKVIDSQGTEGVVIVEIPVRTLSIQPGASGPDSTITIGGSAFPVFNPRGATVSVDLEYAGEDTGCSAETSVVPDATGSFSVEITVPSCVAVGSTNRVIAAIGVGGSATGVFEVATHQVTGSAVVGADLSIAKAAITNIKVGNGPDRIEVNNTTNRIFVFNLDGTMSVIDGATRTNIGSPIPITSGVIQDTDLNEAVNKVYAVFPDTVFVIDGATNAVTPVPSGPEPSDTEINSVNNNFYVTDSGTTPGSIFVISGNTDSVIATIPVGEDPQQPTFNPITNRLYVVNLGGGVTVIDGEINTVITTIPVGVEPQDLAIDRDNNKLFVTNAGSDNVSVVDGATNTVVATIPVGAGPNDVRFNPSTNQVYVVNRGDNSVSIIDGDTDSLVTTIPVGQDPSSDRLNSITNEFYVVNRGGDTVSIISGNDLTASTIAVGPQPVNLYLNPDLNLAYVTSFVNDTITVIDTAIPSVIGTFPAGNQPDNFALNRRTNDAHFTNLQDQQVTVFQGSVLAGGPLSYVIPVTNNGPDDATGVVVTDTLAPGVTFDAGNSDGTCTEVTPGTVSCQVGPLTAGTTRNLNLGVVVNAESPSGLLLINTGEVSGQESDPHLQNNSAAAATLVQVSGLQAEPSFILHQDPADGATGLKVGITRVFDPVTLSDVVAALESFQAQLTY
ncbi:MAG TPA: hypothetical protein VFR55_04475, partial [Dehalococcoidia bacterium]|nr:hypothetical protein [Dehalococcoidia bacterium]